MPTFTVCARKMCGKLVVRLSTEKYIVFFFVSWRLFIVRVDGELSSSVLLVLYLLTTEFQSQII